MATSETLRSVIEAGRASKRLDELSTARVIGKIAEQVHAAEQKAGAGKAIGPVTPESISIDESGAAKLGAGDKAIEYSAPEQVGGEAGDRRSDVFSLGVVMWEALTHEALFDNGGEVAKKAIASPSELNANVPAELGAICMKALARSPADRYQSAKIMAAEIEAVLDDAGYADTNEQIAEFMQQLGKPQALPKVTLITPPMGVDASATATAPAAPSTAALGMTATPVAPPVKKVEGLPAMPPGATTIATPATNGSHAKFIETLPSLGAPLPPVLPAKAEPQKTEIGMKPMLRPPAEPAKPEPKLEAKPEPKIEPKIDAKPEPKPAPTIEVAPEATKPDLPKAAAATTMLGFAPEPTKTVVSPPPAHEPSPAQSDPVLLSTLKTPSAAQSDPVLLTAPKKPAHDGDDPNRVTQVAAPSPAAAVAAPAPRKRDVTPNPASVVALPKAGRESQEVLGGWGWGTDSHQAIQDDVYDDDAAFAPSARNRKALVYVIAGGVAVAALVTIIMVGFGGSSSTPAKPAPQPAAAVQEAALPPAGSSIDVAAAPAPAPSADTGSAAIAAAAPTPAPQPDTQPAPQPPAPQPEPPQPQPPAPQPQPAATQPTPPPPAPAPAPTPPPTPPQVAKQPAPAPAPVHTPTPHQEAAHHAEPPHHAVPAQVAHAAPPAASHDSVEAAYKQGIQQYMRGDTQAALASLRTALAGNPNYPPTWRGLGLVFEKMNEKDQARAAYRRYLQIAPTSSDADQIRSRLDRLGP